MSATSPAVLHVGQMDPKKLAVIYTFSRVAANAFLAGGKKKRQGAADRLLENRIESDYPEEDSG
jgi:hypothetical protein